jgi:hypothetical protein
VRGQGKWVECYPTIKELAEYNRIPLEYRTYPDYPASGPRRGQSPRLLKYEVAKEKGWVR